MRIHRSKILVLALTSAASLMALSAGPALAVNLNLGDKFYENNQTPPEFLIEPSAGVHTLSPTGLTTKAIAGKQIGSSRLAIPAKKIEIVCQKGEITGTAANEYEDFIAGVMKTGAHANATFKFKECTTEEMESAPPHRLTGVKLTSCVPNYDTTPGEMEAKVLLLGKKHENVPYIVALPQVTSNATAQANEALTSAFKKIKFDINICPIPSSNVTGSFSFKPPATDAAKPIWKINTLGGNALIGTKLKFGTSEAFTEAEYEVELPATPTTPWGLM